MQKTTILTLLATSLLTVTGCGQVDISSAPTVSSTSVGTNQVVSTSSQATQSPPTTTPVSAIKGWKVYVDDVYHFSFSYPPSMVVSGYSDKNSLFIDDKYGKHVIFIDAGDSEFNGNLEEDVKSWSGYNPENQKAVNILLEKIVDTTTTIGYLSRWKFYNLGIRAPGTKASGLEIKAKFGSKLGASVIIDAGKYYNTVAYFETLALPSWSPISLDLFRRIASTFQFNQ